jgi:hypothetical protein
MEKIHRQLEGRGILEYWTEKDVSQSTRFSLQTLRNWRHKRTGIPYLKLSGGSVRYKPEAVQKFMEAVTVEPEAGK